MVVLEAGLLDSVQSVYNFETKDIEENVLVHLVEKFIDRYPDDFILQEMLLIMLEFSEQMRMSPRRLLANLRKMKAEAGKSVAGKRLIEQVDFTAVGVEGYGEEEKVSAENRSLILMVQGRETERKAEAVGGVEEVCEVVDEVNEVNNVNEVNDVDEINENNDVNEVDNDIDKKADNVINEDDHIEDKMSDDDDVVEEIPIMDIPEIVVENTETIMPDKVDEEERKVEAEKLSLDNSLAGDEVIEEEEMVEIKIPTADIEVQQVEEIEINQNDSIETPVINIQKKQKNVEEINLENMIENESIEIVTERFDEIKALENSFQVHTQPVPQNHIITKKVNTENTPENTPNQEYKIIKKQSLKPFHIDQPQTKPKPTKIYQPHKHTPYTETIRTSTPLNPYQNPTNNTSTQSKPLRHVVRYKKSSPSPSPIKRSNYFQNAPPITLPSDTFKVSQPEYINARTQLQPQFKRNPNVIVSSTYETPEKFVKYTSPYVSKTMSEVKRANPGHVISESNPGIVNSNGYGGRKPVSYSVVQGPPINKRTIPSQSDRDSAYSRRFKHLKLVEDNKEYKRFQYTTKSREKVNWSWQRDKVRNAGSKIVRRFDKN
jgi:hypothetical protein